MNSLWNFRVTLTIFVLIEGTVSLKEIWLYKDYPQAPLGVIKKRDSTLDLALPREYDLDHASYFYDDVEDKDGLTEEFLIACPACDDRQCETERKLKNSNKLSKNSELLITREYDSVLNTCYKELDPSIEKSPTEDNNENVKYCNQFEEQLYNVGYPVLKKGDEMDIKFMTIYQICYSFVKEKGTLYTIHHIMAPKMLLQRLWEFYELDPKAAFKTSLDKRDFGIKPLDNKQYAYQYVGFDDMPTKPWERTTLFSLNYTLIPKNKDLLQGLITVDNFIRLFSRKTEKPLTLYSGSHQMTAKIPRSGCIKYFCDPKSIEINSFWRIVVDETEDANNAIVVVTQITQIKCGPSYICDENLDVIYNYEEGGCTYTCSVNEKIKESLGLSHLKITGNLNLTFRQKLPEIHESQIGLQSSLVEVNPPKTFDLSDFIGKSDFMSVLNDPDPKLAENVRVQSKIDRHGYIAKIPEDDNGGCCGR